MRYIHEDYSNRRIHIGLIARCEIDEKYGLLYGFRQPPYYGGKQILENKLFYFEKNPDLEIETNTIVSYLSFDYNGFTPKVDYVYPVSSLVKHCDRRGSSRADNNYHDDETWQLINEGQAYFDYEKERNYCIYYPIINYNTCRIWRGLFGCGIYMNKEASILENNIELSTINCSEWPSLEEVTDAVIRFKNQIDSINANEVIDTYVIKEVGFYVSRPGRDDYFIRELHQCLSSDDKYLSYLLPTKEERIFLDNNAYPSDGYDAGDHILNEETMKARISAKTEYTKEKHLAFLINDYFLEIRHQKEKKDALIKSIRNQFDINNAYAAVSHFYGELTDDFMTLLNEYNDSTVKGDLVTRPKK